MPDIDMLSPLTASAVPPAVERLMQFGMRVDVAASLMSAAFALGEVTDFEPVRQRRSAHVHRDPATRWQSEVIGSWLVQLRHVRNALVHKWEPPPEAERLAIQAFELLAHLTPAEHLLREMVPVDRERAFQELAKQIDLVLLSYERAAVLLAQTKSAHKVGLADEQAVGGDASREFAGVRDEVLERAGGAFDLTEAARHLGVSRQRLHKRIRDGSALGMMRDDRIVVPKLQFVTSAEGKVSVVPGLDRVLAAFDASEAGRWSALQFLIEQDPNLGRSPIDALRTGEVDRVEHAARAYLELDEG